MDGDDKNTDLGTTGANPVDDGTLNPDSQAPADGDVNGIPTEQPSGEPMVKMPDGEEVPLSKVEEWQKGYLRQEDYTTKTQELADAQRLVQAWNENPNFRNALSKSLSEYQQGTPGYEQPAADDTSTSAPSQVTSELNFIKQGLYNLQMDRDEERLGNVYKNLTPVQRNAVKAVATQHGLPLVEAAKIAFHDEDVKKARIEGAKQFQDQLKAKGTIPPATPTGSASTLNQPESTPASFREASEQILEELRNKRKAL